MRSPSPRRACEAAHVSNAVGDVFDFPTNAACRGLAQCGFERSHVASVERLAHGRGVGWHVDEPDAGTRLHMEGQELLTDVHGTTRP